VVKSAQERTLFITDLCRWVKYSRFLCKNAFLNLNLGWLCNCDDLGCMHDRLWYIRLLTDHVGVVVVFFLVFIPA